jgi:hypothetical protein
MNKLLILLLALVPAAAWGAPFCVGNFTGTALNWELKTPGSSLATFSQPSQDAGEEWKCVSLSDDSNYIAEISSAEFEYSVPSCMAQVRGGQWIKVTASSSCNFQCEHFTDEAALSDVREETRDQDSGYVLRGIVFASAPVQGATIRVLDRSGKVIASHGRTSAEGFFTIRVPNPQVEGFTVESDGGHVGDHFVHGHLSAVLGADFNVETGFVHLNVPTTLARSYLKLNPSVDVGDANVAVRKFLKLPEDEDLGFSVENPYLKSFSSVTFEQEARKSGGWDQEMGEDGNSVRTFPRASLLQSQGDIVDFFVEKAVGQLAGMVASELFSKFRDGIGLPDKQNQMLEMLKEISAKLDEIKNAIRQLEQQIKEAQYDQRALELWKEFSEYQTVLKMIQETNALARSNLDKEGKPIDPVIADQVTKAGKYYEGLITGIGMNFISHVHALLVTPSKSQALQYLFADMLLGRTTILNTDYFKALDEQLNQYRGFQALAAALLTDAQFAINPVVAQSQRAVALQYIQEEKVMYPDTSFFNNKGYVSSVLKKEAFYDVPRKRLWNIGYRHFQDCKAFRAWYNPQKTYQSPEFEQTVAELLNDAKNYGKWADVVQRFGFSKQEADSTRMVTLMCYLLNEPYNTPWYRWFGNDKEGPWSRYNDSEMYFKKAQDALHYTQISVLLYQDVK